MTDSTSVSTFVQPENSWKISEELNRTKENEGKVRKYQVTLLLTTININFLDQLQIAEITHERDLLQVEIQKFQDVLHSQEKEITEYQGKISELEINIINYKQNIDQSIREEHVKQLQEIQQAQSKYLTIQQQYNQLLIKLTESDNIEKQLKLELEISKKIIQDQQKQQDQKYSNKQLNLLTIKLMLFYRFVVN